MNSLTKIVVVDSGIRQGADLLSTELAELGISSVTTSFEAAEDVLRLVERPAAIFVSLPSPAREPAEYAHIHRFAHALRQREHARGVPVILWTQSTATAGIADILRRNIGADALASSEL